MTNYLRRNRDLNEPYHGQMAFMTAKGWRWSRGLRMWVPIGATERAKVVRELGQRHRRQVAATGGNG